MLKAKILFTLLFIVGLAACTLEENVDAITEVDFASELPEFFSTFSATIDFDNMPSYSTASWPAYITRDNTVNNPITESGALLGRLLFYDRNLSVDNSTSCATCHIQAHAFGDLRTVSVGANGLTGRHSMRLVNARFASEDDFFWDERATSLEAQTTMPIQDHNEMGFSGTGGDPSIDDLIVKLSAIGYYRELFTYAFGSDEITEQRMQLALAQFIRSIQSFDSRYDTGRAIVGNDRAPFPNFTADENEGKRLFFAPRGAGGANCAVCHRPPEFDIRPGSRNNGAIGVFGSAATDTTVTRSPSLRDLVGPNGESNGPFMHDGSLATLEAVVEHYDNGIVDNANLDNRLQNGGVPQNLGLTATQKAQLVLFMKTLSGNDMYTNPKWSDPFPIE